MIGPIWTFFSEKSILAQNRLPTREIGQIRGPPEGPKMGVQGPGGPRRGGSAQSRTKSKNRAETPCATQKCINTNIQLNTPWGGPKVPSEGSNSGNSFPYGADHPSISVPIRLLLKDGPSGAEPPGPELGDPLRGGCREV